MTCLDLKEQADKIIEFVCKKFGITYQDIMSGKLVKQNYIPRAIAIGLIRKAYPVVTQVRLSKLFKRDHSSINRVLNNKIYQDQVERLWPELIEIVSH